MKNYFIHESRINMEHLFYWFYSQELITPVLHENCFALKVTPPKVSVCILSYQVQYWTFTKIKQPYWCFNALISTISHPVCLYKYNPIWIYLSFCLTIQTMIYCSLTAVHIREMQWAVVKQSTKNVMRCA